MPVAGPRAADRAAAHYRWAERYARAGETQQGLAHFGRALDFGGGEESGEESDQQTREIQSAAAGYVSQAFKGISPHMIAHANIAFFFEKDKTYEALVEITIGSRKATSSWVMGHSSTRGGVGAVEFELGQIGIEIDKCAKKLDLDADVRVVFQSLIHRAYVLLSKDRHNGAYDPDSKRRKGVLGSVIASSNPE